MRPIILAILSLCLLQLHAQQVVSFDQAGEFGLRSGQLDSLYRSALQPVDAPSVFADEEAFIQAHTGMLRAFGRYLHENGFVWPGPVRGFNRIYYAPDGRVDYFLYSFRPGQIDPGQEARFAVLLGEFLKEYRLPLTAAEPFSQCGPAVFMPEER